MKLPRHITASRRNGRLSHGPATPEGRKASSRNSLRHGMLANTVVLEDESNPFFQKLLADFTDEHQPSTPSQFALVNKLVVAYWRQIRGWSIEKSLMDGEIAKLDPDSLPSVRGAAAFRELSDRSGALALNHRYETSYDRQFNRCLSELEKQSQNHTGEIVPYNPLTPSSGTWCEFLPNEPDPTNEHLENAPEAALDPATPDQPLVTDH